MQVAYQLNKNFKMKYISLLSIPTQWSWFVDPAIGKGPWKFYYPSCCEAFGNVPQLFHHPQKTMSLPSKAAEYQDLHDLIPRITKH